jgi:hypothetical protein
VNLYSHHFFGLTYFLMTWTASPAKFFQFARGVIETLRCLYEFPSVNAVPAGLEHYSGHLLFILKPSPFRGQVWANAVMMVRMYR